VALSDTFKAISDPVRRDILELIRYEKKSAGEIASCFNLTNATVRTITGELIGGFLLYGIVFSFLYRILYSAISNRISSDSLILTADIFCPSLFILYE